VKPIPQFEPFAENFRRVRLYRDDLETIIGTLQKARLKVSIRDNDFEYETLDEVKKRRGNSPRDIRITALSTDEGYLMLSLKDRTWNVFSIDEDMYGLAHQVSAIVKSRQGRILIPNLREALMLKYRHEPGFFAINRDNIWLLVIGGAIGAFFTFFLWYLIGKPP
jgi:hypothetical protein